MPATTSDSIFDALAATARASHGLDLLILFGSRARGGARPGADWDFGYLAGEAADVPALLGVCAVGRLRRETGRQPAT